MSKKIPKKFRNGRFSNWSDAFIEVPKACWQLTKEIFNKPKKTIFTFNNEGHQAWLSSLGDFISTFGFFITGKENFFGPIRDIAAAIFDWALILEKNAIARLSGFFFIGESVLDFVQRFTSKRVQSGLVHLSFAFNKIALMLYKAFNPSS